MGPDILPEERGQCRLALGHTYCKSPEVVLWMPGWAKHFCQMIYISWKGECRMVAIFWRDMMSKAGHIDCLCGGWNESGVIMFEASESETWKFSSSSPVDQKLISQYTARNKLDINTLYCTLWLLWLSFSQIIIFCLFSRTLDTVFLQTGPKPKLFSTASTGVRQSACVQSPVLR